MEVWNLTDSAIAAAGDASGQLEDTLTCYYVERSVIVAAEEE